MPKRFNPEGQIKELVDLVLECIQEEMYIQNISVLSLSKSSGVPQDRLERILTGAEELTLGVLEDLNAVLNMHKAIISSLRDQVSSSKQPLDS